MTGLRILVTGSRSWSDRKLVTEALFTEGVKISPLGAKWSDITLVHGAARGLDTLAAQVAEELGMQIEPHPAGDYPDPKARNAHMVGLGADVALAFASSWASGTGNCARLSRKAGIPTHDYGVSTRIEDRP